MALLSVLTTWLGGCAIGTRWPDPVPASSAAADETVVLVLTHVAVDTTQRAEFDRQNSRVLASMGQHRGLLAYAARRQVFGDQGWTMSVWVDDEARTAFVNSAVHREAIAKSQPALLAVELKRMSVKRRDVPADWDAAIRLLADPAGRRSYWE